MNYLSKFWSRIQKSNLLSLINPYSAYQILYQLVYLFTSFICLRWILPEEVGVWQTMLLIESYLMFSRFGVFNAFNREFPFYLGKGENSKALSFLYTAEFFALLLGGLFFILIPLSLFFYNPPDQPLWTISVLALALVSPMNIYRNFLDLTYRTNKDFALLAKVQVRLIIIVLLSVIPVIFFGYLGYLARFIFIGVCALSLYAYFRAQPFAPKFLKKEFKYLFIEGLPLFGSNYIQNLVKGIPKIWILYFGSVSMLGLFSPVQAILSLAVLIPASISLYLLPHLNFEYGKSNNKEEIIKNGFKAAGLSMLILLPIVTILWFAIPPLISAVLPNYIEAIFPMQLALVLSFLAAFKIAFNVFTVLKAWNQMYVYLVLLVLVQILVPYLIITFYSTYQLLTMLIISLIIAELLMMLISYLTIKRIK